MEIKLINNKVEEILKKYRWPIHEGMVEDLSNIIFLTRNELKNKRYQKQVSIVNVSDNQLPEYTDNGCAGMDIRAYINNLHTTKFIGKNFDQKDNIIKLHPNGRILVPTGLYIELPYGYEIQVRPRSGLALKNGITVLNSPGTIDSSYRGEIGAILINHSSEIFTITSGDRIAQIVFSKFENIKLKQKETINTTSRGSKGFGSSGIK